MSPIRIKGNVADMEPSLCGSSTLSPELAIQAIRSKQNGSHA